MTARKTGDALLSVAEAAAELGVSASTIRRATDTGLLRCRRSPGGHRRFERAVLEATSGDDLLRARRRGEAGAALRALSDLGELAASWTDIDQLAEGVARILLTTTGAVDCDIFMRDAGDDAGALRCLISMEPSGRDRSVEGYQFEVERFPSSRAAIEGLETLHISDPDDSRLNESDLEVYERFGFACEIAVPLVAREGLVGAVFLYGDRPHALDAALDFVRAAAHTVARALEKALLVTQLEGRNRVLTELFELAGMLSQSYDVDELLRTVAVRMMSAVRASDCDIYRREDDGYRCVVSATAGGFHDWYEGSFLDLTGNPAGAAAIWKRRAFVVDDVEDSDLSEREKRVMLAQGLHSELCIPLVVQEEVVGMIDIFDRRVRDWRECRSFAGGVGQLVAGALENAELLGRVEHRNRELHTLVDSGLEFGATLDVEPVLRSIACRMRAATKASYADISMILEEGRLGVVAAVGADDTVDAGAIGAAYLTAEYPLTGLALEGAPVVVADILVDPRASDAERQAWTAADVRSGIIVPLISGARAVGTAALYDSELREFTEIELLRGLGQVAGQAITNARLYEQLDRQAREAELLNEIAQRTAASLDLGEIAEAAITGLRDLAPIDTWTLTRVNGGEVEVSHGASPVAVERSTRVPAEEVAAFLDRLRAERVVTDGLPPTKDSRASDPDASKPVASAAIGLFDGDELAAWLTIASRRPDAFSALDPGVLERVGAQLSLAARNANLYQEIKHLHLSNLKGLSTALNAKDYYTLGHAARVSAYMVLLGEELGWDPEYVDQVREAAYLHDIGKIGVSDRVLLKQGPLNEHEWELMRQHPAVSADIIEPLFSPELVGGVRHHHERYDGHGYPDGLEGERIPEVARAMCVADSYDAMSLRRPYRGALNADECRAELEHCRGDQFDPDMVDAFLRVLDRLAGLRRVAEDAAAEAAALVDPTRYAAVRRDPDVEGAAYTEIQAALREVRDAREEVRFVTIEEREGDDVIVVVDAEETGSADFSPPGEKVMADDAAKRSLSGRPTDANVLFVDNFGVWVNGFALLPGLDGASVAAVVADVSALPVGEGRGFARMTTETPATTLQVAAVRLSRAEIDAITDGLTGLYNHRYLHELLGEQVSRARVDDQQLSVLFCDLDNFKEFNDRYGHAAGDEALRTTARIIESCTRRADQAARYGGEEFVVVLPGASRGEASTIAQRIRAAVAERHRDVGGLTISIGVVTYPEDGSTKQELLEAADQAMYSAKRLGRDRVVVAGA